MAYLMLFTGTQSYHEIRKGVSTLTTKATARIGMSQWKASLFNKEMCLNQTS